ncbi:MAG TPA: radical SAM protein [Actinomycetota bacterium]|jgi:radical SAM superfamily enzyme YgiQ (UPF0313 family)
MEQLGLSYVASYAREKGFEVDIVDGFLDPDRYDSILQDVRTGDYRLIGYPVYPETIQKVARDVGILRDRGVSTHVTVGNHVATLHDASVLRDFEVFDSTVRGEGEQTIAALLASPEWDDAAESVEGVTYRTGGRIIRNPPRANVRDLDEIPFPARDTLPWVLDLGNAPLIYTSRGCNARCDFCSVHNFFRAAGNGRWRGRSPTNVVDELESLHDRFGVAEFAFADEQFLGHGTAGIDRALGIASEIQRRELDVRWYVETRASGIRRDVFAALKKGGLAAVFMGLESGYDPALKSMKKGLRVDQSIAALEVLKDLEIFPSAGFIMYRPDTSIDEIKHNLDFLETVGCVEVTALATALRVYSGTELEIRMQGSGQLHGKYYDYAWQFQHPTVADCYRTVMQSVDMLTISYNEFARLRRRGLLTFSEAISLQRTMNAEPIAIMRAVVEALEMGSPQEEVAHWARREFKRACEGFLRLLRLVAIAADQQPVMDPFLLKSPMYLC